MHKADNILASIQKISQRGTLSKPEAAHTIIKFINKNAHKIKTADLAASVGHLCSRKNSPKTSSLTLDFNAVEKQLRQNPNELAEVSTADHILLL